jgi:hypothetical protein
MKGRTTLQKTNAISDQMISTSDNKEGSANGIINLDGISNMLIKECNTSFSNYLEWLGLSRDPKLVVLSSVHHYYYDAEEMKNVKTVVNLKELNYIKDISSFLHSMFLILPPKSYLIGCFADNKKHKKQGFFSFSFLDAKTFNYLSRSNVTLLLENDGFKVADMTELNGLTYFCSQSQRTTGN